MIVGFSASPRRNSNSLALLRRILDGATTGGATTVSYDLAKMHIKACTGCEQCRGHGRCRGLRDGMTPLYEQIEQAEGIVLVSPTHHYNVSVSMKAFIDRLYAFYDFTDDRPRNWSSRLAGKGKKAVIAAIAEQVSTDDMGFALEAMERPLLALGFEIVGKLPVLGIFDAGRVADYDAVMAEAHGLGIRVGEFS